MAYDFPDAPTLNQVYGNYTWDGEKWTLSPATVAASQVITTSGSTLSINYATSNYAIINLAHNITTFSVTGWPTASARLTLEIRNTGTFNITFPTEYFVSDGQPTITAGAGKKDIIVLTSAEAGSNVYVHVVGQNFLLL